MNDMIFLLKILAGLIIGGYIGTMIDKLFRRYGL